MDNMPNCEFGCDDYQDLWGFIEAVKHAVGLHCSQCKTESCMVCEISRVVIMLDQKLAMR